MRYTHRPHVTEERDRLPTKKTRGGTGGAIPREKRTVSVPRFTPSYDHETAQDWRMAAFRVGRESHGESLLEVTKDVLRRRAMRSGELDKQGVLVPPWGSTTDVRAP